jgi:hypothetical protein
MQEGEFDEAGLSEYSMPRLAGLENRRNIALSSFIQVGELG